MRWKRYWTWGCNEGSSSTWWSGQDSQGRRTHGSQPKTCEMPERKSRNSTDKYHLHPNMSAIPTTCCSSNPTIQCHLVSKCGAKAWFTTHVRYWDSWLILDQSPTTPQFHSDHSPRPLTLHHHPPRPPNLYHHSLRPLTDPQDLWLHSNSYYSVLVLMHSISDFISLTQSLAFHSNILHHFSILALPFKPPLYHWTLACWVLN